MPSSSEAVRKELIEFLLATKATVERGPGAEYDARVLLLTVEDRCSAGAEYPHAEEWTFDVTEIDELIGLLSATAPQPVTIGAAAAGVGSSADLPQPALLPRHLVRRGMRPDGTFPQSDNDEPEVEDAICEAHNILNCDMCRAPRPATRRSEPEGVAKYLGDKKPENTSPWPQSETPAGGTAKVPDGWKLVPVEVYDAAVALVPLLEDGWDAYDTPEDQDTGGKACDRLIAAVNAMLAAAPSPDGNEESK
jgi:hypothetical protein